MHLLRYRRQATGFEASEVLRLRPDIHPQDPLALTPRKTRPYSLRKMRLLLSILLALLILLIGVASLPFYALWGAFTGAYTWGVGLHSLIKEMATDIFGEGFDG